MRNSKPIQLRDFSRSTYRTAQCSLVPGNSFKLGLNLDSDKETGSLISRLGTNIVGTQAVNDAACLGIYYHRDTTGSNHKLFGVFSDGVNNDIYNMSDGTKSLEDDTKDLKTRFCTFLNSTVRVNGTDVCKSFDGSIWVTANGAFDEANMPLFHVVLEWKDRVYGATTDSNILQYSSVADPDDGTVSWTEGNDQLEIEQEDGGGAITALEKVPGYLLVFKERALKRWDGNSTYPEDLINTGAPTQEAVCQGRGTVTFANQEGVWITNGNYPQLVSELIQDLWDAIPAANLTSIATHCDEKYVYIYVGDITLGDNSYDNILFRFDLKQYLSSGTEHWDIWSYYNEFTCFTWYLSSSARVIVGGDKDGQAIQINTGNTDYSSIPITYSLETQDLELGLRGNLKEISQINVFTENITIGQMMYRSNSNRDVDWKSLSESITSPIQEIPCRVKGNWVNFKITGITDSGQIKILGYEFPEQSIDIKQNATD